MFCTKCGYELRDGDLFCGKCGTQVSAETTQEQDVSPMGETDRAQEVKSVGVGKSAGSVAASHAQSRGAESTRTAPSRKAREHRKGPVKLTDEQKMQIGLSYAKSVVKSNRSRGFFSLSGRAPRSDVWVLILAHLFLFPPFLLFDMGLTFTVLALAVSLTLCFPTFVRRLHDLNRSGWTVALMVYIPMFIYILVKDERMAGFYCLINQSFWLLLFGFVPGMDGQNQYGENPSRGQDEWALENMKAKNLNDTMRAHAQKKSAS